MRRLGLGLGISEGGGIAHSRIWQFSQAGLVTLPPWLTFSCASARTAQTSASALLRNIGTNQAVANMWGLQHEPQATNYNCYSEDFSSWVNASAGTQYGAATDPAGNNTAQDIGSASYGYYTVATAPSTANLTQSIWLQGNANGTKGAYQITGAGFVNITSDVRSGLSTTWNRFSTTYSGAAVNTAYAVIQGGAPPVPGCRCNLAFCQVETLAWSSSYIPAGVGPVTRAASNLSCSLNNTTRFSFRLDFIAAVSSATMQTNTQSASGPVLAHPTYTNGYFGLYPNAGNLVFGSSVLGNVVYDTHPIIFNAGDLLSVRYSFNNSTSYTATLYINNVLSVTTTITHTSIPTFASSGNTIGSLGATGLYLAQKGISYIGIQ